MSRRTVRLCWGLVLVAIGGLALYTDFVAATATMYEPGLAASFKVFFEECSTGGGPAVLGLVAVAGILFGLWLICTTLFRR